MTLLRLSLAALLVLLSVPCTAHAAASVTISGTTRDFENEPLGGVHITVRGPATVETTSDSSGRFLVSVVPGTYAIIATKAGFTPVTLSGVEANAKDATVSLVFTAATLSTVEIATVHASARSSLNTGSSAAATLSGAQLADSGVIQVAHALDQIPGVIAARAGNGNAAVPGSITSPNLRGAVDYEKATLLDGHPLINGRFGDYPVMLVNRFFLDDIEIVKGPGAYAPQINYSIGGTMNMRTLEPTALPHSQVTAGLDNFGGSYVNLRATGTATNDRLSYAFDAGSYGTPGALDNYNSYVVLPAGATVNGIGTITSSPASSKPLNGQSGPYPISGALGNPSNAYTSLVACCQTLNSSFATHFELAKLRYRLSSATVATATFLGLHSTYDALAASFAQLGSVFSPGAGYNSPAFTPGQSVTINATTTLPGSRLIDNQPIFEGEVRTTLHNDTLLARYYTAVLDRETVNDVQGPLNNYVSAPMTLWGTAAINGSASQTAFNGSVANVTIPTPYTNQAEQDVLRGFSFEDDHPLKSGTLAFAVDRTSALTNAYSTSGSSTNAQGTQSFSIPAGTQQTFTTFLLRGTFALGAKTELTLAHYYDVYKSTYTLARNTSGSYAFATSTTTHMDPRVGIVVRPNANMSLRFNAGSAVAPPYPALIDGLTQTPSQIYKPGNTTITLAQNAGGLLPETSFGYDVGADVRLRSGWIASFDAYLTNVRNQFVSVTYPSGTYTPSGTTSAIPVFVSTNANLGNSRYQGLEATLRDEPTTGIGYRFSLALENAYPYNIPASFYASAAGPYTSNLDVLPGQNFVGDNKPFFSGVNNKSAAYAQGYAGITVRSAHGHYGEFGLTYYGNNNTYNEPAFVIASASYRQPLTHGISAQLSADNLFNQYANRYVTVGGGIASPLANGQLGLRNAVPYGPATLHFELSSSL